MVDASPGVREIKKVSHILFAVNSRVVSTKYWFASSQNSSHNLVTVDGGGEGHTNDDAILKEPLPIESVGCTLDVLVRPPLVGDEIHCIPEMERENDVGKKIAEPGRMKMGLQRGNEGSGGRREVQMLAGDVRPCGAVGK